MIEVYLRRTQVEMWIGDWQAVEDGEGYSVILTPEEAEALAAELIERAKGANQIRAVLSQQFAEKRATLAAAEGKEKGE